jgi:acetyl esterase/lipase
MQTSVSIHKHYVTETIKNGILNETDSEFLDVLAANDTYDWNPVAPITLYYGTADDYVFPLNSETAYDALLANGANVDKVTYEGKNHETAFFPYLIDVFELFESLK